MVDDVLTEYTETMLSAWNALVALGVPPEVASRLCERLGPFCQGEACRVPDGRAAEVMRRFVASLTGDGARSTRDRERTASALLAVAEERERQDAKWGERNHPLVGNPHAHLQKVHGSTARFAPESAALIECHRLGIPSEREAREACEEERAAGNGTFASIAVEELAEAVSACVIHGDTSDEAREELVQTTAVLLAMIEAIDRRRTREATEIADERPVE